MDLWGAREEHPGNHTFRRYSGYSWWTFWVIHQGGSRCQREETEIVLRPGTLNLFPPDHPYEIKGGLDGRPWEETYALFSALPEWVDLLEWPAGPMGLRTVRLPEAGPAARQFDNAMNNLVDALRLREGRWAALRKNAFERVLLLAAQLNPEDAGLGKDPRVREVVRYITQNLHHPLSVEGLAQQVHLSAVHLSQLFRRQMGQPIMRFVEAQRIGRARELLQTTQLPIKQVASMTGFENPLHFSTRFRLNTGRSPRQYRRVGLASTAR